MGGRARARSRTVTGAGGHERALVSTGVLDDGRWWHTVTGTSGTGDGHGRAGDGHGHAGDESWWRW
ncbi:hypothetical protein CRG98_030979 [Punica granatum]|uniref:Uncharacterized protein n=1 Tax=Punica granatum TaxID=22663 RepID=A0A2I0IX67_PUNGR|nr:hypothetical protein CRG98_030979 [Punica granatum]